MADMAVETIGVVLLVDLKLLAVDCAGPVDQAAKLVEQSMPLRLVRMLCDC